MRQTKVNGTNTRVVTLENGLTVVLIHDPRADAVSACVGVKYGGAYENPDTKDTSKVLVHGIAHLLEHCVLRGTLERSAVDTWRGLKRFAYEDNAETDHEKTIYYFEADRQNFSRIFSVLSDTIRNATLAENDINDEKKVVMIEKLERDEKADWKTLDLIYDMVVEGKENVNSVIGNRETIKNIDREKLVEAYRNYYTPDNSVVAICGALKQNDALKIVKKHFGDWEGKAKVQPIPPVLNHDIYGRDVVKVNRGSDSVSLTYAFETLPVRSSRSRREHMALELIKYELHDRIQNALRLTVGNSTIYHPEIMHEYGKNHSLFTVTVRMDPLANDIDKAKQLLHEELKRTFRGEITKKDLIDHRDSIAIRRITRDTNFSALDQAMSSAAYYIATGTAHYSEKFIKELKKISPEYIRHIAAKYLDPDKALRLMVVPEDYLLQKSSVVVDGEGI